MADPLTQRPTNQTVFEALLHLLGVQSAQAETAAPIPQSDPADILPSRPARAHDINLAPDPARVAVPLDARTRASSRIDAVLSGQPTYGGTPQGVSVYTAHNPPPPIYSGFDLKDDPQMEMAVRTLQDRHPTLFGGVNQIFIGAPQDHGIGGYTTSSSGAGGGAMISLGHSGGDFHHALDILRHELAHVAGLKDTGSPSAYDVGSDSGLLHTDINLSR